MSRRRATACGEACPIRRRLRAVLVLARWGALLPPRAGQMRRECFVRRGRLARWGLRAAIRETQASRRRIAIHRFRAKKQKPPANFLLLRRTAATYRAVAARPNFEMRTHTP